MRSLRCHRRLGQQSSGMFQRRIGRERGLRRPERVEAAARRARASLDGLDGMDSRCKSGDGGRRFRQKERSTVARQQLAGAGRRFSSELEFGRLPTGWGELGAGSGCGARLRGSRLLPMYFTVSASGGSLTWRPRDSPEDEEEVSCDRSC